MSGERSGWLAFGLALSVLANLFLAGVIVGALTMPQILRPLSSGAQGGVVPRAQIRQLPVGERTAFVAVVRMHAGQIKALHERVRAARAAAAAAIGTKYDRALLEQRFAAFRQAQLAQSTAGHEAVIEALGTLSAKSRAAIGHAAQENAAAAP
jgi:uncharacterized membrane protein